MHALHCLASTDQNLNAISEPGKISQEEQDSLRSTRSKGGACTEKMGKTKQAELEQKIETRSQT